MQRDAIVHFRRFARAVTREVGALDSSFLGRGRPLGAARVLNAIGAGHTDVAGIRDYLGLDSGLMSRLLRGLEDEGLIATRAHAADARYRVVRLTRAGRKEFDAYERLSDKRAADLMERFPRSSELLRAMDTIASALSSDRIAIEEIDPRDDASRSCLEEYYAELAGRFAAGYDVATSSDPQAGDMLRPRGAFLIARSDGLPVGCVALKRTDAKSAEIKRLWVSATARGLGIGKRLMSAAEDVARELSVTTLRLDTNDALHEALALYRASGWVEIARFNDDPYPDRFFEKHL